ncbi:hypothetical protein J4Q44_G00166020 [Coregonus suidteri]|uniref:Uncharacterized protein n=1 Tax=Coregonus suidteri TaxID=861788 RepID=A0AAN8LVT1_9TELE
MSLANHVRAEQTEHLTDLPQVAGCRCWGGNWASSVGSAQSTQPECLPMLHSGCAQEALVWLLLQGWGCHGGQECPRPVLVMGVGRAEFHRQILSCRAEERRGTVGEVQRQSLGFA